jgi:hypothetical protein
MSRAVYSAATTTAAAISTIWPGASLSAARDSNRLVNHVLSVIGRNGIEKFHIDLFSDNDEGFRFWVTLG